MKKSLFAILLAILSLNTFSQITSGTWNSRAATYTNSAHRLKWQLIEELDWVGRPILGKSTVFKVRNDDTHILVDLVIVDNEGQGDIWDHISEVSPLVDNLQKQQAEYYGMTYLGSKFTKSQLSGFHAIRVCSDMKKYYPEHRATIHSIARQYVIKKGAYLYTCTVTGLSVHEEEIELFERIATQIFNGFEIRK